jgi:chromate transporter
MSLFTICLIFLRLGALAFGGLGATLALLGREIVDRRGALSRQDVTDALTYTKVLPGSTVVQVVAYIGWRLGGWCGAAIATAAFLLPSAVLMALLAAGYAGIIESPAILGVRQGVLAVVVAVLLVTMERLSRPLITGWFPVAIGFASLLLVLVLNISAVWAVVASGVLGVVTDRARS